MQAEGSPITRGSRVAREQMDALDAQEWADLPEHPLRRGTSASSLQQAWTCIRRIGGRIERRWRPKDMYGRRLRRSRLGIMNRIATCSKTARARQPEFASAILHDLSRRGETFGVAPARLGDAIGKCQFWVGSSFWK
jgi:hypothetical protein